MIAVGGAAGALCRYWLMNSINMLTHGRESAGVVPFGGFPFGTLAVNFIGSFVIGILYVLITERMSLHPDWRSIIIVGFLGAFTTFSTFSLETVTLLENGHLFNGALYMLSSVVLCVLGAWIAIYLTRMF